jgi:hypothetical protein
LCGYVTWSLTLREEHRLRVFEDKVLRRMYGLKMNEVTSRWRELHKNEDFHNLYSLPNIIRMSKSTRMRRTVHVARIWDMRNALKRFENTKGKKPLGRPRCRWKEIKMDFSEIGFGVRIGFIRFGEGRWRAVAKTVMERQAPKTTGISSVAESNTSISRRNRNDFVVLVS